jgi:hypothetical protein
MSAIFLDSLWTPDRNEVPPQLKNNIQSGLRVLEPHNWMFMDKPRLTYEMMLSKAMMGADFKFRDAVLITT